MKSAPPATISSTLARACAGVTTAGSGGMKRYLTGEHARAAQVAAPLFVPQADHLVGVGRHARRRRHAVGRVLAQLRLRIRAHMARAR
jgi:hypothetical protein